VFNIGGETILLNFVAALTIAFVAAIIPTGGPLKSGSQTASGGSVDGDPGCLQLRNLWTRRLTTLLTIAGMALVVFVFGFHLDACGWAPEDLGRNGLL